MLENRLLYWLTSWFMVLQGAMGSIWKSEDSPQISWMFPPEHLVISNGASGTNRYNNGTIIRDYLWRLEFEHLIWLVVEPYLSEKWWSSSVGMIPNIWKYDGNVIKVMFQSTNQNQSSDINDINQIIFHTWVFPKIWMMWLYKSPFSHGFPMVFP